MTFFHECQMSKVSRIVYLLSWKKKSDNNDRCEIHWYCSFCNAMIFDFTLDFFHLFETHWYNYFCEISVFLFYIGT